MVSIHSTHLSLGLNSTPDLGLNRYKGTFCQLSARHIPVTPSTQSSSLPSPSFFTFCIHHAEVLPLWIVLLSSLPTELKDTRSANYSGLMSFGFAVLLINLVHTVLEPWSAGEIPSLSFKTRRKGYQGCRGSRVLTYSLQSYDGCSCCHSVSYACRARNFFRPWVSHIAKEAILKVAYESWKYKVDMVV